MRRNSRIFSEEFSIIMTTITCPVCNKHTPLSSFNPQTSPVDIRIIEVKGKGRGRGFEKISDNSIFDIESDEFRRPLTTIYRRVIETVLFLIENEAVTADRVAQDLGLDQI
jgi:hypothetical protein